MYEDQPVAHYTYAPGEKFTSRSIVSLPGNPKENFTDNLFIMSTNSLKKDNEIHFIQFSEEEGKIKCQGVYTYPGVINKVFSHPSDETIAYASVSSYAQGGESHKALVFRVGGLSGDSEANKKNKKPLNVEVEIPNNLEFNSVLSSGKDNKLILSDSASVFSYDIEKKEKTTIFQAPEGREITKCEIDPHHPDLIACVQNNYVSVIDTRDNQFFNDLNRVKYEIKEAHTLNITDIDFNPNKPYCILTGGEDCQIKFWDIRKSNLALKVLDDLTDNIESVRYNKQHDLLILSSNGSGSVNLHKVTSVSSAPILSTSYIDKVPSQSFREEDLLVKCYEEQEDSVSAVAWSAGSPWIFASVSYRGSVIVSMVPPAEKYKILL